jgi:hypothetical protein
LQSQAYKVMSKQKQLSNASNPEYVGSRFFWNTGEFLTD